MSKTDWENGSSSNKVHAGAKDRPLKADLNTEINPRFAWLQTLDVPAEDNDPKWLNCPRGGLLQHPS